MRRKSYHCLATTLGVLMLVGLGLASWPTVGQSQAAASTAVGQATAARAVLLGLLGTATSASLVSTGISSTNSESDVAQLTGGIPSLLTAEALNAATYSYPNEVDSTASLGSLGLTVAGIRVTADSVVAQASQPLGAAGSGSSYIANLAINGVPIIVTGSPNQTIPLAGGQIILNEQTVSSSGSTVVNAIHVALYGVADVVLASANASIS